MADQIADIRKDYKLKEFSEEQAHSDPIEQFSIWWQEATASKIDEVNAMTLATASADGLPSARIVLLKAYDNKGFVFFTNYGSYKGKQLEENPRACLVFFWKELERQVRVTGLVSRTDEKVSDQYFDRRPEGSRMGAMASPQSQVITERKWLEDRVKEIATAGKPLERPDFWGGFIVRPITIEFWQGRSNRLHDRLQYSLQDDNSWKIERLAP